MSSATQESRTRLDRMDVIARNHVVSTGRAEGQPMLFSHGFGCDQNMWRLVAPAFEDRYRVVLFDHVGAGQSDLAAYDRRRYSTLAGYAEDVLEICRQLDLKDVIFVGHSVSAMIGVLAAASDPSRFDRLVLVGPSPRYLDDDGYVGGFSREDIDGLLDSLESNYLGWSAAMAPVIMGNPDRPENTVPLNQSAGPGLVSSVLRVICMRPLPWSFRRRGRAGWRRSRSGAPENGAGWRCARWRGVVRCASR
jgi:sigma-B regulation protein RsbQ